jgi:ribonucleoside-triphosphate reductase
MTLDQINTRLEELKEQKAQVKGLETEVYARIVGYYRSVRNWNKGKKEEYGHRLNYADFKTVEVDSSTPDRQPAPLSLVIEEEESQQELLFSGKTKPASYLYFFRKTCPNCPPVAGWLKESGMEGRDIDVDRESGMHEALRYDISSAPTVVFLDENGKETGRGNSIQVLETQVGITAAAGA